MEGIDVSKYWMLCIYGIIVLYVVAWFILNSMGKANREKYEKEQRQKRD